MSERTLVVMPAYNAQDTLERTLGHLPDGCCDEVLVVDDASTDATSEIAARLPVSLVRHERNLGYGGNQKTCYREALARGADFVVMVHPDDQYDARLVPAAVEILRLGVLDLVLGNRIRTRREALSGGMPRVKYLANRGLTLVENMLTGQNLGEWHSGFRAYRRELLETVPFERNSDDFVFDSQLLLQAVHFGFRVGDIPMPVRYFEEASSISFRRASTYAMATLGALAGWYAHRLHLRRSPRFMARHGAAAEPPASPPMADAQ
jgi:glycosyltransferase involved in cell wall biosynthesis